VARKLVGGRHGPSAEQDRSCRNFIRRQRMPWQEGFVSQRAYLVPGTTFTSRSQDPALEALECPDRSAPARSTASCLADRPMRAARSGSASRRFIASAKAGVGPRRAGRAPRRPRSPSAPSVVETGAAVQPQRHHPRRGRRKVRPQGIPIPAKAKAMTPCVDPSHVAAIRLKEGDVIMCFDRCRDLTA